MTGGVVTREVGSKLWFGEGPEKFNTKKEVPGS